MDFVFSSSQAEVAPAPTDKKERLKQEKKAKAEAKKREREAKKLEKKRQKEQKALTKKSKKKSKGPHDTDDESEKSGGVFGILSLKKTKKKPRAEYEAEIAALQEELSRTQREYNQLKHWARSAPIH